jgi:predicted DNA-binding transcriptional regulator AlpA
LNTAKKIQNLDRPYLNATEAAYFIHYGKSQFHAEVKRRPDFPQPVRLSSSKILWKRSDLEGWLQEQIEFRQKQ